MIASDKVLVSEDEIITNYAGSAIRGDSSSDNVQAKNAMIAGYVAGCSGTIVGYPLDSLKVWMQTDTIGKNAHIRKSKETPKFPNHTSTKMKPTSAENSNFRRPSKCRSSFSTKSIPSATLEMKQKVTESATRFLTTGYRFVRASYSGATTPLITVGMVQSVNFATYDASRQFFYNRQHPSSSNPRAYLTNDSLRNVAMSGSIGGATTACITAPFIMVKINQQITGNTFRRAFREIFTVGSASKSDVCYSIWNLRPFRSYGAAFVPHILFESFGRALYVSTYEWSKRSLANSKTESGASLSLGERVLCAGASGIVSWATFFPCDALRNRMYHAAASREKTTISSNSILETIRVMHTERAFYRGFSISILRAAPVAAAVLPVYDIALECLSSWK